MRCRAEICTVIFILGFLVATSSFAESTGVPELPAQYYGKVNSSTPLNGYIEAKIGNKTYATIPLVNNTFGGPTYLDEKLLVYAPGKKGKEVKFYLNGTILLNTSDTVIYNPGDVRYIELYYKREEKTTETGRDGGDTGPSPKPPITKIVAEDIKSEEIRYFVYRAELIVGSEIDVSLSAKYLKTIIDLTDRSLEIKEDCILVGGPVANPVVRKYIEFFPVKVTNEYPGKNRGVIEKTTINGHTVILLAGSDRWGTKAAVEYFKTLEDLPDEPIFVEWRNERAVRIERP